MTNLLLNIIVPVMPHISSGHAHHCVTGGNKDIIACFITFLILSIPGLVYYVYCKVKNKYIPTWSFISFLSACTVLGLSIFILITYLIYTLL